MDEPGKRIATFWKRLDFQRQALHAARLGFVHPYRKQYLRFESEIPADMQELFDDA